MGICYIVGAGDCREKISPLPGDLVIAADGGADHLAHMGMTPDLLLGDLDSLRGERPSCPLLRYPAEKDDTDMALCVEEGVRRGYTEFLLFGMLGGGRFDHSLSATLLLPGYAERGLSVTLVGGGQRVTSLSAGQTYTFPRGAQGYLSLFALAGQVEGLTATGVKYPLKDATLSPFCSLGVSNEFLPGQLAAVTLKKGRLLLVWQEEWGKTA